MSAQVDGEGLKATKYLSIGGPGINMCAYRASSNSVGQFYAYCQTFRISHSTQPTDNHTIAGIGGTREATVVALVLVPFKMLVVFIDVISLVLR